ncbi:hypothetical protein THASP1DRAFT_32730 [Thamnocephalis sphaerospora]|uniref:F-box domain-containing protein n=1 Tax=Thamnocephalis sphaerospora TaxID=78915 RepID=A0A4P9XJR2_9FUNG|nr:hypothetical protein THASP1DRAFT_32730 [Thamnocephalis sphaerospora]|eukprot:RKP05430.1 hypothetical protein THASP1DRAFT_32730 [Thamnocephalis sphaerospora]
MTPNAQTWLKPNAVSTVKPHKLRPTRRGGRRHQRSAAKQRVWPNDVLRCIVRHIQPDDMRTAARLAACSRQWQRVILQDADFGRRLYRASYLLGAPEERDWLRWWLKDAKASTDRADREDGPPLDTELEVNWPQAFLARRQLEMAWRTGAQVDGEATVARDVQQNWPLRPRLRQVRLPVEKGERVSVLASGPAGAVLRVAREGRVMVLENRADRAPRVYELSDKGMQGMPGVLTTAPPRVLRGRGMRRSASGAAHIPGLADARMNDRFVVLLVAESIAAAVTTTAISPSGSSMFVTPRHTLCVWKMGHEHMAYRVDNFPATRLVSLRGRWLVVPRSDASNGGNGTNSTGTTPILGTVSNGYTVYDLARHACEVGNFGSSFGRGCVQASDDRSLLVYACGVVGHRHQLLWEQWSVKSMGDMRKDTNGQSLRNGQRRASRTGMLPIENVDRDATRVYAVDADHVLVLYVQTTASSAGGRRARLAMHSTRNNTLVWDRDLARHRDLHSMEIFAEAGVAMVFLHPDVDVTTSVPGAASANLFSDNDDDDHGASKSGGMVDVDALAPPRCLTLGLDDGMPRYQCHWPWAPGRPARVLGSVAAVNNADGRRCLVDVRTGQPLRWLWPPGWEEVSPVQDTRPASNHGHGYDSPQRPASAASSAGGEAVDNRYLSQHLHPPHAPHSRSASPCIVNGAGASQRRVPTPLSAAGKPAVTAMPTHVRARDDELCVTSSFAGRVDRYGARFIVLDYTHRPAVQSLPHATTSDSDGHLGHEHTAHQPRSAVPLGGATRKPPLRRRPTMTRR